MRPFYRMAVACVHQCCTGGLYHRQTGNCHPDSQGHDQNRLPTQVPTFVE